MLLKLIAVKRCVTPIQQGTINGDICNNYIEGNNY